MFLNIPLPGIDKSAISQIQVFLDAFSEAAEKKNILSGVASEGEAAAYALVWEWGNARQTKQGPKTTLGVNPDGESVWLTIQAPTGYIGLGTVEYMRFVEVALSEMDFSRIDSGEDIIAALKTAALRAAAMSAELIRQNAPVDSGQLRDSIRAVGDDDPDLKTEDFELELGEHVATALIESALKSLRL